jgi:hypothetical protein
MSKPGIDQLLIASALQPDLRQRVLDNPDEAFLDFDLTEEQKDILRQPDHRLLRLLGETLARQAEPASPQPETLADEPPPHPVIQARSLPDMLLALTIVPYAQIEDGQIKRFLYGVWVNPLAEGADPASLPLPPTNAGVPGQALPPSHVVIQFSAVQLEGAAHNPQVGLWASLRQSSNVTAPPPAESAGRPDAPPFGSDLHAEEVQAAVAAVRNASSAERYERVIDLMRTLRGGEVR